jgi:DNA-binding NarL/FixJ family response regulator
VIKGNNIAGVLSWIQYSATDLEKRVKEQIDAKVREGVIKPREGVELQNFYESVLHGYTYVDYEKQARLLQAAVEASAMTYSSGGDRDPAGSTMLN